MTPEEYLATKAVTLPTRKGVVELVTMEDALHAVRMAKGEATRSRMTTVKGSAMHLKDLSGMTEQQADEFIGSLGALGYDTDVLRRQYRRTKIITI